MLATLCLSCSKEDSEGSQYGPASITSIEFQKPFVLSSAIDEPNGVVTYVVPEHITNYDLSTMKVNIIPQNGATMSPKDGDKLDFTQKEQTLIVVSADGRTTKEYTFKREKAVVDDLSLNIANDYALATTFTVNGKDEPVASQNVQITRTNKNLLRMVVKGATIGNVVVGDFTIDNISLYDYGSNVTGGSIYMSATATSKVTVGSKVDLTSELKGQYIYGRKELIISIAGGLPAVDATPAFSLLIHIVGKAAVNNSRTLPLFVSVAGDAVASQEFDGKGGGLTFYVAEGTTNEELAKIKPTIVLPEGATWTPYNNTPALDFTAAATYYDVIAADGVTKKRYAFNKTIIKSSNALSYNFTDWKTTIQQEPVNNFDEPVGWQTPNGAVIMIKSFSQGEMYPYLGAYPVEKAEGKDGPKGTAASLTTLDTKGGLLFGSISVPKVTSGTIFTGKFNAMAALGDAMLATEFGLPYSGAKPTSLKGWYKYTPGPKYFDITTEVSKIDQPSISVILYDVTDNPKATITGKDTYTSERIIGYGMINPAAASAFSEFEVKINYTKSYEPSKKLYKLAIIMSASKDGAQFKGAPLSTLVIDEVQLMTAN